MVLHTVRRGRDNIEGVKKITLGGAELSDEMIETDGMYIFKFLPDITLYAQGEYPKQLFKELCELLEVELLTCIVPLRL